MTRALHEAGVRSVVSSLWKVNDDATRVLMTEFYRNLWERNMAKIEALRQAQLTMIRRYDVKAGGLRTLSGTSAAVKGAAQKTVMESPPPRYWAAFQLSGDWR